MQAKGLEKKLKKLIEIAQKSGAKAIKFQIYKLEERANKNTKEEKIFKGKKYILEEALHADFALIKAEVSDRYGNLTYNKTARNFNPIMSMAAKNTLVQAKQIVQPNFTNPEHVITPGIFVQKIIEVKEPIIETIAIEEGLTYP